MSTCTTTTDNQTALPCQPECGNYEDCQLQAFRSDYSELGDIVLPAPHEQEEAQ